MEQNIALYSLRAHGYLTQSGTHASTLKEARLFTPTAAALQAQRSLSHEGASIYLPVNVDILHEIQGTN